MDLQLLLRAHRRHRRREALDMVPHDARQDGRGGIYDHLGGGFHRYSVDERWLVPHFEKMLYDNAPRRRLYLEAVSGRPAIRSMREIARETLDYVLRDMTDPERRLLQHGGRRQRRRRRQVLRLVRGRTGSTCLTTEECATLPTGIRTSEQGNFEGKNILIPLAVRCRRCARAGAVARRFPGDTEEGETIALRRTGEAASGRGGTRRC